MSPEKDLGADISKNIKGSSSFFILFEGVI